MVVIYTNFLIYSKPLMDCQLSHMQSCFLRHFLIENMLSCPIWIQIPPNTQPFTLHST